MTTRLTMLVHGRTDATRRASFALDESLDARGRESVTRLAAPRCDRALTSPATAARETAAALGLDEGTDLEIDAALSDLATGAWAGQTFAEVAAADPAAAAAFLAEPSFDGHGGESIVELIARQRAFLADHQGDRGRIVAVTHQAVVRAVVVAALGTSPSTFWQIDVEPLGSVTLTSNGVRWALRLRKAELDQP